MGAIAPVAAASGDYAVGQVTGAAPLASPTFTGTMTTAAVAIGDGSNIAVGTTTGTRIGTATTQKLGFYSLRVPVFPIMTLVELRSRGGLWPPPAAGR
jgi:hypothetical protein